MKRLKRNHWEISSTSKREQLKPSTSH